MPPPPALKAVPEVPRRWPLFLFVAGTLLVLTALGWVTAHALALERREREAQAAARHEENIRLALWRMDSTIAPLLAREAARPYFEYQPFYPAASAYTRALSRVEKGEVLVASPLLLPPGPFIRLHFERDAAGVLHSPQAPTGDLRALAESSYVSGYALSLADEALEHLRALQSAQASATLAVADNAAPIQGRDEPESSPAASADAPGTPAASDAIAGRVRPPASISLEQNALEYQNRVRSAQDAAPGPTLATAGEAGVSQSAFAPRWLGPPNGPELIYTRTVEQGPLTFEQGFWLNWPALRTMLLTSIRDLLPAAALRPLLTPPSPTDLATLGCSLASLPAMLIAPMPVLTAAPSWTPLRTTLTVTWAGTLAAAIAMGAALHTSLDLAERRGRFVSAVTHELRTPLTTFSMYADMLDRGMVPDDQRTTYLRTLREQSQRLTSIVQSVLEYARLSAPGPSRGAPVCDVSALCEHLIPMLRERAVEAGMTLTATPPPGPLTCRCEPLHIERILSNLIDNACKYAGVRAGEINLVIASLPAAVAFTVTDHGPGIPPRERRHIFRPFVRGSAHAAEKPGLGLGLALARELARSRAGDLQLIPTSTGSCFRLTLPKG